MDTNRRLAMSPIVKLIRYCAACQATSTFVWMDQSNAWACIGNPTLRLEGCGKRLWPVNFIQEKQTVRVQRSCRAASILSRY
jgi:hypothetical protein